ncbi:hypothetical protein [Propionibacterium freudenreichii]|uniref:hypothetical protein n=1 Tax=Propionibacterium freudenreichii TaxID=1744 RepID=UPI0006DC5468|nr:hypothetical protein [Propionibacterium freudenreichii]MDK9661747.1 hypothetical protein [Propionibacterium freudenreichii]
MAVVDTPTGESTTLAFSVDEGARPSRLFESRPIRTVSDRQIHSSCVASAWTLREPSAAGAELEPGQARHHDQAEDRDCQPDQAVLCLAHAGQGEDPTTVTQTANTKKIISIVRTADCMTQLIV